MKKIFVLFGLLLIPFLFSRPLAASVDAGYKNLIDYNQLSYDISTDIVSSKQGFKLNAGKNYTIIASKVFFADKTKNSPASLINTCYKTHAIDNSNKPISIELKNSFFDANCNIYASQITPSIDCTLYFDDFLVRGANLDTLRKDLVIFYEGEFTSFKGFRAPEYLDGYSAIKDDLIFYTDIMKPLSIAELLKNIKLYDNVDGFSDNFRVIEDNYSNSTNVGQYLVKIAGNDSAENIKILNVIINVIDTLPPSIVGPNEMDWDFTQAAPTIADIKKVYKAIDGVDGDVTDSLYIETSQLDKYVAGKGGYYPVTIAAKDKSGNISRSTIFINAKDVIAPTLIVKDLTVNLSEINAKKMDNILRQMVTTVEDNSGSADLSFGANEYYENGLLSGSFEITITATDGSNNKTTKTAILTVKDDINPEFYLKTDFLNANSKKPLSEVEIKGKIKALLNQKGILCDKVHLLSTDYFLNSKQTGTYNLKYFYEYNGQVNYASTDIVVNKRSFNYAYLALLIIPVGGLVMFNIYRKRKSLK